MPRPNGPLDGGVVGIDPGLNTTGYAVLRPVSSGRPTLVEAGIVRSTSRGSLESRLVEIHQGVRELLAHHRPCALAVEQLFSHYKRPRTAILMGHARGVICLAAAEQGLPVCHYGATQVKKLLTGSGRATKLQMQRAICHEFGLAEPPEPADVADALAIAITHIHFSRNQASFT